MKLKRRFVAFVMCLFLVLSGLQITPATVKAANPVYSGTHFAMEFDKHDVNAMEMADGWTNGGMFNCTWKKDNISFADGKMNLKIDKDSEGYTGGEYRSREYFGYGMYQVNMKPIKNPGVVTSFFTYTGSSDGTIWDEIDIEFLGYDTTKVQFNYFSNSIGEHEYLYDLGFDASEDYHTYGFYWGQGVITWYVDGKAVHTVESADVPVTPGKIMMNVWPGTGVDKWLQPYNGKTPLSGSYDWIVYDAPTGNADDVNQDDENTDKDTAETPDTENTDKDTPDTEDTDKNTGETPDTENSDKDNTEDDKNENSVTHFGMDLDKHEDTMEMADGWTNGGMFNCTWSKDNISFADGKMNLKIDKDGKGGYTGGEYRTRDYYGYGMYQVNMKPIKNPGVVSSFFTYTGPTDGTIWDEIDIEFLGYDTTKVQFNYFSNGVGEHEYLYDLGFDATEEYHTYGFYWEKGKITWYVDNEPVHTVESADVPVTPGKIMMNVWPGTTVDDWLQPYDGKTPLTASYDWAAYDAPQGEGEVGKDDTNGTGDNEGKDDSTGEGTGDNEGKDDSTGEGTGDNEGKDDSTGEGTGDNEGKDDSTGEGTGDNEGKDDTTGEGTGDNEGKDDGTGEGTGDNEGKDDSTGEGTGDNEGKDDSTGEGTGDNEGKDDTTGEGTGDNEGKDDTTGEGTGDNDNKKPAKPEDSGNKEECKHDTTEVRNAIEAACGGAGYTGDTYCTVCNQKIAEGKSVAISHTWDAGTIIQQPTAALTGTKTYTCTVCKSIKLESIPATGEKPVEPETIPGIVTPVEGTTLIDTKTGAQYKVLSSDANAAAVEYVEAVDATKKTVVIPNTVTINNVSYKVTGIAAKAFAGNKNLRKVVIGKNVNKIGTKAFFGCKKLKNITIKANKLTAKSIGKKAFAGTSKGAKLVASKKLLKAYKKIFAKKGMIF